MNELTEAEKKQALVNAVVKQGKEELADKYLNLFSLKSGISVKYIQEWIPLVAASQMTKGIKEEQEFLSKWISVADYQ